MRVVVGADHLGYQLKEIVAQQLRQGGNEVVDVGCFSTDEVDYPDVAAQAARLVAVGDAERAVLVCGTGLGMAIAANKVPGIRAATVSDPYSAERAQKSNNAQVLCLGSRVIGEAVACMLVDIWMGSSFGGGASERKVNKISALEHGNLTTRDDG